MLSMTLFIFFPASAGTWIISSYLFFDSYRFNSLLSVRITSPCTAVLRKITFRSFVITHIYLTSAFGFLIAPVLLLTQSIDERGTRQARGFFLFTALAAVGLAIVIAFVCDALGVHA